MTGHHSAREAFQIMIETDVSQAENGNFSEKKRQILECGAVQAARYCRTWYQNGENYGEKQFQNSS